MDFYNHFAKFLKGSRSFIMLLITLGLGCIEYLLVTYFIKVFNLLSKEHTTDLTFVIVLGIIMLIALITTIFYQCAISMVLVVRDTIRSKDESGLRWIFGITVITGISFSLIVILLLYILMLFLSVINGTDKIHIIWEIPLLIYTSLFLLGITAGLIKEFSNIKYSD